LHPLADVGFPFREELPGVDASEVYVKLLVRMSAEEAVQWLHNPHPQLGDREPHPLIDEGRKDDVLALLKKIDA